MAIRVLIVEDEPPIADFLVRGLAEEGFAVEHSADGDAALDACRAAEWDLILLDWWLPGRDGLSVLRSYRESGGGAPVLMLTARDAVSNRVRGLESGADDYLCKPFAFAELVARIRALVRRGRRERAAETVLECGGVQLDLTADHALRGGKRIELTAKERALLALFMRRPEQLLSRNRIYEDVWDEPYDGISNTLEVHIMELRRKLEKHGPRLIHTVRGRGYCFGESEPASTTSRGA